MPASAAVAAPTRFLDADGTRFAYRRFGVARGGHVAAHTTCTSTSPMPS
jgi:hypothetical protein